MGFQNASLGLLPAVITIELTFEPPRASYSSVHGGGHITNTIGMVSQDYKPHQILNSIKTIEIFFKKYSNLLSKINMHLKY